MLDEPSTVFYRPVVFRDDPASGPDYTQDGRARRPDARHPREGPGDSRPHDRRARRGPESSGGPPVSEAPYDVVVVGYGYAGAVAAIAAHDAGRARSHPREAGRSRRHLGLLGGRPAHRERRARRARSISSRRMPATTPEPVLEVLADGMAGLAGLRASALRRRRRQARHAGFAGQLPASRLRELRLRLCRRVRGLRSREGLSERARLARRSAPVRGAAAQRCLAAGHRGSPRCARRAPHRRWRDRRGDRRRGPAGARAAAAWFSPAAASRPIPTCSGSGGR